MDIAEHRKTLQNKAVQETKKRLKNEKGLHSVIF